MFCTHCGKELADNALMCPSCGSPTSNTQNPVIGATEAGRQEKPQQKTKEKNPAAVAGFVLSAISFVLGFILITCIFALYGTDAFFSASPYVSLFVLIPAFGGLALNIYGMLHKNLNSTTKFLCILGLVFAGITIFYFFLGLCLGFMSV